MARTNAAEFDAIPGVELANFAMNKTFRDSHEHAKGCGGVVFRRLVLPLVERAAQVVGVAALYIFSLPEERVMANYGTYGLERLDETDESALHARLKPRYDEQCVFMYMMLWNGGRVFRSTEYSRDSRGAEGAITGRGVQLRRPYHREAWARTPGVPCRKRHGILPHRVEYGKPVCHEAPRSAASRRVV